MWDYITHVRAYYNYKYCNDYDYVFVFIISRIIKPQKIVFSVFFLESQTNNKRNKYKKMYKYHRQYRNMSRSQEPANYYTKGSACFYNESEKVLISGDTVFYQSYGRTDLPGGSEAQMQKSLSRIFETLPDDVLVYPGHGACGFELGANK